MQEAGHWINWSALFEMTKLNIVISVIKNNSKKWPNNKATKDNITMADKH